MTNTPKLPLDALIKVRFLWLVESWYKAQLKKGVFRSVGCEGRRGSAIVMVLDRGR